MLPVGIGDAIRVRRERAGLTQEALGALLAVHPDVVDDWEWGEAAPAPEQARRLALILGLSERALLAPASRPDGEEAVVVYLVPCGRGEAAQQARLLEGRVLSGPVPVPPRPSQPPPRPAPMRPGVRSGAPPDGERDRSRQERPMPVSPLRPGTRFRRAVGGVVAALLVTVAVTSGLAAYRQGELAARHEAEARALRSTLVVLAGERDRLAARIAELTAALAEAGFAMDGAAAFTRP